MNKIEKFYTDNFNKYGKNLKSIGWSNKKDQILRFNKIFSGVEYKNKSILDVGCGFGDLYFFLRKKNKDINFKYSGIDITPNFVEITKERLSLTNSNIYCGEVFNLNKKFDIVVASGSMSYNFKGAKNKNLLLIKKMYEITKKVLSMNFMSSYSDFELKKNLHYNPEEMFQFAKRLSPKVNLIHDYNLYEFTIQIFKND
jgi:SAM-dependent methyltransferase